MKTFNLIYVEVIEILHAVDGAATVAFLYGVLTGVIFAIFNLGYVGITALVGYVMAITMYAEKSVRS